MGLGADEDHAITAQLHNKVIVRLEAFPSQCFQHRGCSNFRFVLRLFKS